MDDAFGVRMDTLMRMQSAYDIAQIRKREKHIRWTTHPSKTGLGGAPRLLKMLAAGAGRVQETY